jgi:small subunit ribosomal protein S8
LRKIMTDPISDMLTRMRNAIASRHTKVDVPASRLKIEIARILKEEGYITNYSIKTTEGSNARTLRIFLRYGPKGESVISRLERISRPSRRVYVQSNEVAKVLAGLGINILSTSQGVMTGKKARKAKIGGEVLCNIY